MGRLPSPALISDAASRSLERRLNAWARRRGPAGALLIDHMHAAPRRGGAESPRSADPYWLLLPGWLLADSRVAAGIGRRRGFLFDILWAQYCVFLFVRLHDDVLDGDCETASLAIVSCAVLMEAERTFARQVDTAAFRQFYRNTIATTFEAGVRIDVRQRSGGGRGEALRDYAAAAAIFKLGAAAVCMASRRTSALGSIWRFADEIAIADQIMDDIFDLDTDLKRGRINYAAACLRGSTQHDTEPLGDLSRAILCDDGIGALADEVDGHLQRAARAAASVPLAPAVAYAEHVRGELTTFRQTLHRARVEHLLSAQLRPHAASA